MHRTITGVIAECDPLHHGHAALFRYAKKDPSDRLIVVLSGDFTQRGMPSCVGRSERVAMLLSQGVDLVLAMPVRYATSSAEDFADAGVGILSGLGICDRLLCGAETSDNAWLMEAASFFAEERDGYRTLLRQYLKEGYAYPKARSMAAPLYEKLLSERNSSLAIEYGKSILKRKSNMQLVTYPRNPSYRAGSIREAAYCGDLSVAASQMPEEACSIFSDYCEEAPLVLADDFSMLLQDRIQQASSAESFLPFMQSHRQLAGSIYRERDAFVSFTTFANALKTKDRTYTAICRALTHLALGIRTDAGPKALYAQVLGFRREGEDLFGLIREHATIPVVSKAAHADRILTDESLHVLHEDLRSIDLYNGVRTRKGAKQSHHAIAQPIVIV